jgi:hypothetical protein
LTNFHLFSNFFFGKTQIIYPPNILTKYKLNVYLIMIRSIIKIKFWHLLTTNSTINSKNLTKSLVTNLFHLWSHNYIILRTKPTNHNLKKNTKTKFERNPLMIHLDGVKLEEQVHSFMRNNLWIKIDTKKTGVLKNFYTTTVFCC